VFKSLYLYVLLLIGFVPSVQAAQDLVQTYELSVESDPQLKAQMAVQDATGELTAQARALFLPEIGFSADASKIWTDTESDRFGGRADFIERGYTLSLIQPIYRRNNFVQGRQAEIAIQRESAGFQLVAQGLIIRVAESYFEVLGAQDDVSFAEAEREAISKQLEEAEQRFEVGLATITDVTEARAAFDIANAAVIAAENALANSKELLRETAGLYPDDLAPLRADTPLLRPEPEDINQWSDVALLQNPALHVVGRDVALARESIEFQRSGHYPTLDLVARASYIEQTDSNLSGPSETNQEIIGLQFNLPIFAGGSVTSRTREAGFRLNESMEIEEQQRRAVLRQTRAAYNSVMSGISQVQALEQAVASNEKALEATEAGFDVGTRTTVDVLNARRELFSAKRDYARSRYEYIVNTLRLKQAAGIVSFDDLQQINQWLRPS